jgi:uncharacterized protein (TIGR03435 family)
MRKAMLVAAIAAPLALAVLTAPRTAAQTFQIPPGARAEAPDPNVPLYFEAASVKPNKEGGPGAGIQRRPGGRLNTTNTPVNLLITFAYQIQGYQLIDVPDWARNERFDIVAKLEGDPAPVTPPAPDHMMLAMRTLLADRFKLKLRKETREMDIYALVMARPGGKPGQALKVSTDECGQRQGLNAPRPQGESAGPPTRLDGTPIFCGMRQQPGRIQFNGMPLSQFAQGISPRVGRQVVDRTGLTGEWSFELSFAPPQQGPPGADAPAPADPNAPDLFTAVQEQLGLKLEATKGPVDVYVVESIERPTED